MDFDFNSDRRVVDYPRLSGIAIHLVVFAIVSLLGVSSLFAQRGAITLPRNLSDLSRTADRIVQGRVIEARVEAHPDYKNLQTLVVTLQVDDMLKGSAVKSLTFRQFIWDTRDIADGAGYRIGDEILLFLNPQTSLGLSSPVGLDQGRFRLARNRAGDYFAINGNGNTSLFTGLIESRALDTSKLSTASRSTLQTFKKGPISLITLKESTRALLQNPQRTR